MKRKSNTEDELQGFGHPANHHDDDVNHGRFTKKQSGKKNSGGFQAMGLSFDVLKGITRRGYKIPTPIQRKVCEKVFLRFKLSLNITTSNRQFH